MSDTALPPVWVVVKDGHIIGTHDEPCTWDGIDGVRYDPPAACNPEWADKDITILVRHLREDTNFDATMIEQMLAFAQCAAKRDG